MTPAAVKAVWNNSDNFMRLSEAASFFCTLKKGLMPLQAIGNFRHFLYLHKLISLSKQHTLGKNERLKSRKLIEQLFKEGKSFAQFPYRVYYQFVSLSDSSLQFGAAVSARNFKKAVDRNRVKRLTREAYRQQKTALTEILSEQNRQLAVFFIYTAKVLPVYEDVYSSTTKIIRKLTEIIEK